MNSRYNWAIGVGLLLGLTAGCKENGEKPVTMGPSQPAQPSGPAYPEPAANTLAPPPSAGTADTYTPPVDTTPIPGEERPAARSGSRTASSSGTHSSSSGSHEAAPRSNYARSSSSGKTYTVKKGDTLQEISQKMYGTTRQWRKIYNANKGTIKGGPEKITPGMKLTIPPK
jgi:nucleoid-associated protein YgaU